MGIFRGIKRVIKPLVNVKVWMDTKTITEHGQIISETAKDLFRPSKSKRIETFEEAMKRLNLTEEILLQRTIEFKRLVLIFSGLAILCFAYGIYLLLVGGYIAFLFTLVVTLLILTQAFRYHFWLFQIKRRKLGCSFKEWLNEGLLGGSK